MARNERVQTNFNPGAPAVRAVAAPVTPTVQAQRAPSNNQFSELASALSRFSPKLEQFAVQEQQRFVVEQESLAEQKLNGMTLEEANALVKSGKINETESPWFQAAFTKLAGIRRSNDIIRTGMAAFEESGDKAGFDVDDYIQRSIEDAAKDTDNKFYLAGLNQNIGKARETLLNAKSQAVAEETRLVKFDNILNTMRTDADELLKSGKSPEAIAEYARNWYETGKQLHNMSYRDTDGVVLELARQYAEAGRTDVVRALTSTDRTSADGMTVPALIRGAKTGKIVEQIIGHSEAVVKEKQVAARKEHAYATAGQQAQFQTQAAQGTLNVGKMLAWNDANNRVMEPGELQSLIANNAAGIIRRQEKAEKAAAEQASIDVAVRAGNAGMLYLVTDEKQRRQAIETFIGSTEQTIKDPEQRFNVQQAWFANNGVENPMWKQALNFGAQAGTLVDLTKAELPPAVQMGMGLYKQMKAKGIATASYMDTETETYYDAVDALQSEGGLNDKQAWATTREALGDKASYSTWLNGDKAKQVREGANKYFSGWWKGTAVNQGTQVVEFEKLALMYSRIGLSPDDAYQRAGERIQRNYTNVNGIAVRRTSNLPPDDQLTSAATATIAEYKKANPQYADVNLRFRPHSNNNDVWVITDENLSPVLEGNSVFKLPDLMRRHTEQSLEAARAQTNASVGNNQQRQAEIDANKGDPTKVKNAVGAAVNAVTSGIRPEEHKELFKGPGLIDSATGAISRVLDRTRSSTDDIFDDKINELNNIGR